MSLRPPPSRIVLTTFGSLGDLHPYLAIGIELPRRGHRVALATHAVYREMVERHGLGFHAIPPDLTEFGDLPKLMRDIMDERRGSETIVRRLVLPFLTPAFQALTRASEGADLLVTHPLAWAGTVVAERHGLKWAAAFPQPAALLSAHDPAVLPAAPWLMPLRPLRPHSYRLLFALARIATRSWTRAVDDLRVAVGLARAGRHPLLGGQFSPFLNLALFSRVFASPQPDWPPRTVVTGFPIYDRDEDGGGLSVALQRFLDSGSPPIVFTLGSAAVMDAGSFYGESALAAERLGYRALLLVGRDTRPELPDPLPPGVQTAAYAPYSEVFPRAAAVVHQGGIGTTGQALRAGRPMLIVPYSHDQPDNAARIVRLGVGRWVPRRAYGAARAARELSRLLEDSALTARAAEIGRRVCVEHGAAAAANAIEELLSHR